MSRLLEEYNNQIKRINVKTWSKKYFEVPKIKKIILNMGIGDGKDDSKLIDKALEDLTLIAGQKAVKTKSKKQSLDLKLERVCL